MVRDGRFGETPGRDRREEGMCFNQETSHDKGCWKDEHLSSFSAFSPETMALMTNFKKEQILTRF